MKQIKKQLQLLLSDLQQIKNTLKSFSKRRIFSTIIGNLCYDKKDKLS